MEFQETLNQLVNCPKVYNLGLAKAAVYHQSLGDTVAWGKRVDLCSLEYDAVYLSALFTRIPMCWPTNGWQFTVNPDHFRKHCEAR